MTAEVVTWIDADGVNLPLDGSAGVTLLVGAHGRFMPSFALVEDNRPLEAGTRVRKVRTLARDLDLPLIFEDSTYETTYALMKTLLGAFDPSRGPGVLRVVDPLGDSRELPVVFYTGGLELSEVWPEWSPLHRQAVLSFHAPQPYWEDSGDTTVVYASDVATAPTFFPFFPLNLSSGTILTSPTLLNAGDVEFWPVWTVNGPGTDLILLNVTTGKFLSLAVDLELGDQVIIDTRPGIKTVVDQDGQSLYSLLSATSEMWPFPRGSSTFQVQMNAADANSEVHLRYRQRYLAP